MTDTDAPDVLRTASSCTASQIGLPRQLLVNSPGAIAGTYASGQPSFGPNVVANAPTQDVVRVIDDGSVTPTSTTPAKPRLSSTRRRSSARSPSSTAAPARLGEDRACAGGRRHRHDSRQRRRRRGFERRLRNGAGLFRHHHSDGVADPGGRQPPARPAGSRGDGQRDVPAGAGGLDRQLGPLADGRGRDRRCPARHVEPHLLRQPRQGHRPAVHLRDRRQRRRAQQLRCSEPRLRAARRRRHLQRPDGDADRHGQGAASLLPRADGLPVGRLGLRRSRRRHGSLLRRPRDGGDAAHRSVGRAAADDAGGGLCRSRRRHARGRDAHRTDLLQLPAAPDPESAGGLHQRLLLHDEPLRLGERRRRLDGQPAQRRQPGHVPRSRLDDRRHAAGWTHGQRLLGSRSDCRRLQPSTTRPACWFSTARPS